MHEAIRANKPAIVATTETKTAIAATTEKADGGATPAQAKDPNAARFLQPSDESLTFPKGSPQPGEVVEKELRDL